MILRPFLNSDAEALVNLANNPNIAKTLTDRFPHPYSLEDGIKFIEFAINAKKDTKNILHVIEVDGKFSGGIGLHPEEDIFILNAEIAYWVGEPYWKRGIIPI
jgi:ribosomal-protein-alanine N-acetyltransferase